MYSLQIIDTRLFSSLRRATSLVFFDCARIGEIPFLPFQREPSALFVENGRVGARAWSNCINGLVNSPLWRKWEKERARGWLREKFAYEFRARAMRFCIAPALELKAGCIYTHAHEVERYFAAFLFTHVFANLFSIVFLWIDRRGGEFDRKAISGNWWGTGATAYFNLRVVVDFRVSSKWGS